MMALQDVGGSMLKSRSKAIIIEWPAEVIDVWADSGFTRVHYDPVERRFDYALAPG